MARAIPTTCQRCGRDWPSRRAEKACPCRPRYRTEEAGPESGRISPAFGRRGAISRSEVSRPIERSVRFREGVREMSQIEREEVLRVTGLLMGVLVENLQLSEVGAARAIRWAAHVQEGRMKKEEKS